MKKVFISSPMKGLNKEEILEAREKATAAVKERLGNDVEIIDSYFSEFDFSKCSVDIPIYCLGRGIIKMSEADFVVFTQGWEKARGCRLEHIVAQEYGKNILIL